MLKGKASKIKELTCGERDFNLDLCYDEDLRVAVRDHPDEVD